MNLWKKNLAVFSQKEYYNFPKKSVFKVVLGIVAAIVVFFIFQTILPMIEHVITGRGEDTLGNTSLLLMGFGNILAALVIWLCFVRKDKKYYPKVTKKMTVVQYISGVFFCLAFSGIISLLVDCIKYGSGLIKTEASVENLMSSGLILQIIVSVISAAIAEEVLMRGCIQNRLMCRINNAWAFILTAAIFGLIHGNVSQFITATVTGFAFCFVYAKTHSIVAAILAHMINNLVACLQADFLPYGPDAPAFWIFNIVLIVVSIALSIPFIKADAAVICHNDI